MENCEKSIEKRAEEFGKSLLAKMEEHADRIKSREQARMKVKNLESKVSEYNEAEKEALEQIDSLNARISEYLAVGKDPRNLSTKIREKEQLIRELQGYVAELATRGIPRAKKVLGEADEHLKGGFMMEVGMLASDHTERLDAILREIEVDLQAWQEAVWKTSTELGVSLAGSPPPKLHPKNRVVGDILY